MPNEITEALMVKEPLVDLARLGAWGVFMECDGVRPPDLSQYEGSVTGVT